MTGTPLAATAVDRDDLESRVKAMYARVALAPDAEFHFEMGRGLALRLGYAPADLDRVPAEAVQSFAGVGHHFDLAALREGETVLDLGSGSGMDSFVAALAIGPKGSVVGIDMTAEQRDKAERLRDRDGFARVRCLAGYIEDIPCADSSFDAVISNGVINLSSDKRRVFGEIARVLRQGGRMAISDIVSERQLPESIVGNATLWAACIGGAAQQESYRALIEAAGLEILAVRDNPQYVFTSDNARGACETFGVESVSILARKP